VTGRRHVAIVAGAVALSGAAWVVTGLVWDESEPSQYVVERGDEVGTEYRPRSGGFTAPPCTPPPELRDGPFLCVRDHPDPGR
jgi:hypothetical protein